MNMDEYLVKILFSYNLFFPQSYSIIWPQKNSQMEQVYDMHIYNEMSSQDILKKMWNKWGWINDNKLLNSSCAVALRAHLKKCKWWGSSSSDGLSVLNTSPLGEACNMPQMVSRQRGAARPCVSCWLTSWPDSRGQRITHAYSSVVVILLSSAVLTKSHSDRRLLGSEESGMLLRRKWLHYWEFEARNDGKVWLERRGLAWGYTRALRDAILWVKWFWARVFLIVWGFTLEQFPSFKTTGIKLWQLKEGTACASVNHFGMAELLIP